MINGHKSMSDLTPVLQARTALAHILDRVRRDPYVGWYLGYGTESFALATEALASITGSEVLDVRKTYAPEKPRDPQEAGRERFILENPKYQPKFDEAEVRTLRAAIALLEDLSNVEALAAATTTKHDGLALLQKSERMDDIAGDLRSLKLKYEE